MGLTSSKSDQSAIRRASYAASSGAAAKSRSIPTIIAVDVWMAEPEPDGSLNTMLFPNETLGLGEI